MASQLRVTDPCSNSHAPKGAGLLLHLDFLVIVIVFANLSRLQTQDTGCMH